MEIPFGHCWYTGTLWYRYGYFWHITRTAVKRRGTKGGITPCYNQRWVSWGKFKEISFSVQMFVISFEGTFCENALFHCLGEVGQKALLKSLYGGADWG